MLLSQTQKFMSYPHNIRSLTRLRVDGSHLSEK